MQFDSLLTRAGDETLQALIGTPALRLLHLLDPGLLQPRRLRELAVGLHGRASLLLDAATRTHLLELLNPKEAQQLAHLLGCQTNPDHPASAYEALRRIRITRNTRREQRLLDFFLVDRPVHTPAPVPPARAEAAAAYPLFPHQRRAAREVAARLKTGSKRVLLHMPTGAGKTRTAMNVIAEHLRTTEPGLVVWFAYSEELCEQAAQEFERAWSHLGNRPVAVHRFWGPNDLPEGDLAEGLVVAGLSKTYSLARQNIAAIGRLGSAATLVIIDEAHQAIAETYRLVLEALLVRYEQPGLLGLSATPGRTWSDIDEDERLARFFARQKVTLEVPGYDNPVDYLVDEGYLARPRFEPLFYEAGNALSDADLERVRNSLDVPASVLQRLAEDEQRNLHIVLRTEDLLARHRRVLVFAATVWHAELLAAVLQARGHDTAAVTGTTPPAERAARIARFKGDGEAPRVLCNYGVLTTGFDAPQTSAALIARPTQSLVLYSQMVGRAIRGPRAGGNAEAEIVTVVDAALPGFGDVAEAFLNWEDVWT